MGDAGESDDSWGPWTAQGNRGSTSTATHDLTARRGRATTGDDDEGDSDDSWGDWGAAGNTTAANAAASDLAATALLPGLWAEVLESDFHRGVDALMHRSATRLQAVAEVAAIHAAVDTQLAHQRMVLGYNAKRAMAAFLREAALEAKAARRRQAQEQQARTLARAAELLAAEQRLAAAKQRGLAATGAVVAAEGARQAMTDPCFGRWERVECQQHLHRARKEEVAAFHELCAARKAAALRTNTGSAATSETRRLAAVRALAGGALPRELHFGAKAGARTETWREAESDKARQRRQARKAQDELCAQRAERRAERWERQALRDEDRASGRARRAWQRRDERIAKNRAHNAVVEQLSAERKRGRDRARARLEEAAKEEEAARRRRRGGRGTGAGRREDGPAAKELKALLAAEGAGGAAKKPKAAAVPRRPPFRGEDRDRLGGLLTFYNPREGNDAGLAQHFLGGDEVAEAWAEVAESDGSDG